MHRRSFLEKAAILLLATPLSQLPFRRADSQLITVTGPLDTNGLGYILPHEHILVDFIGAVQVNPDRYDRDKVMRMMLPYVEAAKDAGCTALFDCTPTYLGRDVQLLLALSQQTGLPIITNTGYYGAVQHKYLPAHAFTESAGALADRWIAEFNQGIEGTGIRPGFIKISVDKHPLDPINRKLVQAAAITHKATGLTVGSHTGSGGAALEQIEILRKEGVSADAFVWIHAQNEKDRNLHLKAARMGAWVAFDNLGWEPASVFLEHIRHMKGAGLLDKMLVSHDAGWYDVEKQGKSTVKPFTPLFNELIPALKKQGWDERRLKHLFHHNPIEAYHVHKRLLGTKPGKSKA